MHRMVGGWRARTRQAATSDTSTLHGSEASLSDLGSYCMGSMSAEQCVFELASVAETVNMQLSETRNAVDRVCARMSELRQRTTQAGAAGGCRGAAMIIAMMRPR